MPNEFAFRFALESAVYGLATYEGNVRHFSRPLLSIHAREKKCSSSIPDSLAPLPRLVTPTSQGLLVLKSRGTDPALFARSPSFLLAFLANNFLSRRRYLCVDRL